MCMVLSVCIHSKSRWGLWDVWFSLGSHGCEHRCTHCFLVFAHSCLCRAPGKLLPPIPRMHPSLQDGGILL